MGLRRSVWQALGGFDQMLGVGAPLLSAEDTDLTIRALLGGYFIYETPRVAVVHNGFYRRAQRRMLIHKYWYGTGATFAKQLKCGRWSIVGVMLRLARGWAVRKSRPTVSVGSGSYKALQLAAFARGLVAGAVTPVEKTSGHYVSVKNDLSTVRRASH
jgi:hypothetical protein